MGVARKVGAAIHHAITTRSPCNPSAIAAWACAQTYVGMVCVLATDSMLVIERHLQLRYACEPRCCASSCRLQFSISSYILHDFPSSSCGLNYYHVPSCCLSAPARQANHNQPLAIPCHSTVLYCVGSSSSLVFWTLACLAVWCGPVDLHEPPPPPWAKAKSALTANCLIVSVGTFSFSFVMRDSAGRFMRFNFGGIALQRFCASQ